MRVEGVPFIHVYLVGRMRDSWGTIVDGSALRV